MKLLPENLSSYKTMPVFTQDTVPQGLLKDHKTPPGVWGKIVVLSGKLKYVISSTSPAEVELSVDKAGIIEPEVRHHVQPIGDVEFYLELFR